MEARGEGRRRTHRTLYLLSQSGDRREHSPGHVGGNDEGVELFVGHCAARKTSQASVASIALEVTLSRVLIEEFKLRCVAAALRRQKLYGG